MVLVLSFAFAAGCDVGRVPDGSGPEAGPDAGAIAGSDPAPEGCPRVRVNTESLNVRATPSVASEILTTAQEGDLLDVRKVLEAEAVGGVTLWFEVEVDGQRGFVTALYASCTTDPA